jgi:hypothetical protein
MADRSVNAIEIAELSSDPTTPASGFKKFYPKTDGKFYSKNSAGTVAEIGGASGGGWTVISVSSTPYNVVPTTGNILYLVDATAGAITLNVPTAVGNTALYAFKKTDTSANTVIVDANSTETINGDLTAVIQYKNTVFQMTSDNANFNIIA